MCLYSGLILDSNNEHYITTVFVQLCILWLDVCATDRVSI